MAYRQVSEIMDLVGKFHTQLAKEIQRHSSCSDDPRLEVLNDLLKYQRDVIQRAIERDKQLYPEVDVLNTWIQFVPEKEIEDVLQKIPLQSGEPLGVLFTHVVEADQALVTMYESLAEQSHASHVREFFDSLRKASISFAEQRSWGLRTVD